MGDHRADIKIEFSFHGKTYKMDAWINWCPDSDGDWVIDRRVVDFFRASYEDGMGRYNAMVEKNYQKEHAAEIEAGERAQLKQLKEKYPE